MIIDSRYKVLKRLGEGLWATVFKVEDLRTGVIYALKIFQRLDATSLFEKFSAEDMHHISKIEHPNLIRVVNFGNMGKHIYYLSEFYDGQPLSKFKFSKSNISIFYDIIIQICYAMNALHMQDILHKDIKPDNIMYKLTGSVVEVKILDYGFTKIDIEKNQQKISGTLPYVAPEIYLGKEAKIQSDYYSLGVTLYRITTGLLPFTLEQISSLIAGKQQNFFPKFLRELNSDIPPNLERFILKLLEKNPSDRFSDIKSIISHINRIQPKKYPFTQKRGALTTIKFQSYFIRKEYTHQLLDYVDLIAQGNGKIISVIGTEGLGKNNMLSLFRFHLITGEYFLFDYTFDEKNRDPFFAMIKEFYNFANNNQLFKDDLSNISQKLKSFLFESEENARNIEESNAELNFDFESARQFMFHLSETKPLIFIIRGDKYLTKETINFTNYISKEITRKKILIIICSDDPGMIKGLIHTVQFKVEPLNFEQTKSYVEKILNLTPSDTFLKEIWYRSCGNPKFISKILIDLTKKNNMWSNGKFVQIDILTNYELPIELKQSILDRLKPITQETYSHLRKLAVIATPISTSLIKAILEVNEKEIYSIIHQCEDQEIFIKREGYYHFSYKELRLKLISETPLKTRIVVSKKILDYFSDKEITIDVICEGIIESSIIAKDYIAERKYKLKLLDLLDKQGKQDKMFSLICNIIELDFSKKIHIEEIEFISDLNLLCYNAELSGSIIEAIKLLDSITNFPDVFEKYYIRGRLYVSLGRFAECSRLFQKALSLAVTGKQIILVKINLIWVNFRLNKIQNSLSIIQEIKSNKLSDELSLFFLDRKSIVLNAIGKTTEAIQLVENFLSTLNIRAETGYQIKLGNLYNNLAHIYSSQKMIEEANKNFQNAKKIWEKVSYIRSLGTVYNNIGDLSLKQGDTKTAFEYFEKAMVLAEKTRSSRTQALTYNNFGEAFIKLGLFKKAIVEINKARKIVMSLEDQSLLQSIISNLALAKSKINSYNNLFKYIKKEKPEIINGEINSITPIVKTYFYYLFEIGRFDQIQLLINKLADIFITEHQEEEFYYQIIGMLAFAKKKYQIALYNFNIAMDFAHRIKSSFSQAILHIRKNQCFFALKEFDKAKSSLNQSRKIIEKYDFAYWKIVLSYHEIILKLNKEKVSYRIILREILVLMEEVVADKLFILEIKFLELLIQIYTKLKAKEIAENYYKKYLLRIKASVKSLPQQDKDSFLQLKLGKVKSFEDIHLIPMNTKEYFMREDWQNILYDLLKLNEVERMKFFIDKTIRELLSPYAYSIMLYNELITERKAFICYNCKIDKQLNPDIYPLIDQAMNSNKLIIDKIDGKNIVVIPLKIRESQVGCMILSDFGELEFRRSELGIIKVFKIHLTSILMRIKEFANLNSKMKMMQKLMTMSQDFFSILDLDKLEQEFVSFALQFTGCTRGFLIKKDEVGNYVYQIAIDDQNKPLTEYTHISRTVMSDAQATKQAIYTLNAKVDNTFKSCISVQDYDLHTIFCAPIIVDANIYGLLYLDNYKSFNEEISISRNFMDILLKQVAVAFKNAQQYQSLIKKNWELHTIDRVKNDFMNIVSHELNTPLVTLQGFVKRLKSDSFEDPKSKNILLEKVENNVKKLLLSVNDINNLNKYSIMTEIVREKAAVHEVFEILKNKADIVSRKRKMKIKLELEEFLPVVMINWEAFHLMVYNVILNAIRFTSDYGTIIIGARLSAFHREEINGSQSLVIYIQDNGIGIPEAEQEKVFKKFYESKDLYAHKSGLIEYKSCGLGLGLATAKRIAELHSGKIWLQSKKGEGTTVFIAIPIVNEMERGDR